MEKPSVYRFGPFVIDIPRRVLRKSGQIVPLTPTEFEILSTLVRAWPDKVERSVLIANAWGQPDAVSHASANRHISSLRKKLGAGADGLDYLPGADKEQYQLRVAVEPVEEKPAAAPLPVSAPVPTIRPRSLKLWTLAAAGALLALAALAHNLLRRGAIPKSWPVYGRILVHATSEGKTFRRIRLPRAESHIAVAPGGGEVYLIADAIPQLLIVDAATGAIRAIDLPEKARDLAVSKSGTVYIASAVDGLMVLGPNDGQPKIVRAGGPVYDLAVSAGEDKVFLAMGQGGVKRLSIPGGNLARITDRVCPVQIGIDPERRRLLVPYQCGGPEGRSGHDSVELFDTETENSLGIAQGPPLVGGSVAVSPDGTLAIVDGQDACSGKLYDGIGCRFIPGNIVHILRPADHRFMGSLEFGPDRGAAVFVDNSRLLLLGSKISVMHSAKASVLEEFDPAGLQSIKSVVSPRTGRIWVLARSADATRGELWELVPESGSCAGPSPGPSILFTGDGTLDDTIDLNQLGAKGPVAYAPGKVGQAFHFEGSTRLSLTQSGYFQADLADFTIAFYARAQSASNAAFLDWARPDRPDGIRIGVSPDGRIVAEKQPGGLVLQSSKAVTPDAWVHVAFTVRAASATLFVNGEPVASNSASFRFDSVFERPIYLGAAAAGGAGFRGDLDEVAFYNRALSGAEIRSLFQMRESGACQP